MIKYISCILFLSSIIVLFCAIYEKEAGSRLVIPMILFGAFALLYITIIETIRSEIKKERK